MSLPRPAVTRAAALCITILSLAPHSARAQDFFSNWEKRVEEARRDQPEFTTPMFSTTPRIVEAWRSDFTWRTAPDGSETTIYGSGKGLDFVPYHTLQITVNLPPYTVHREAKSPDGYGDWPMLVKYRLIGHGPSSGNDVLTAVLSASLPTGGKANGAQHTVLTPQLIGAKAWGDFDVVAGAGVGLPASGADEIGHALAFNVVPQYRVTRYVKPAVELNVTSWRDGTKVGETQAFLSPEVYFGKFPLYGTLGSELGVGMQIAVTKFHQYDHALDLSFLFPF